MGLFRFTDRWQTSLGRLLRPQQEGGLPHRDTDAEYEQFLTLAEQRDRALETYLEIPSTGFWVTAANNGANLATGNTQSIVFDTVRRDVAGSGGSTSWKTGSFFTTFTVPAGESGFYVAEAGLYTGGTFQISLGVLHTPVSTGVAIGLGRYSGVGGAGNDVVQVHAMGWLTAGDTLQLRLQNSSGVTMASTVFAGDTNINPYFPYFKVCKVANP